MRVAAAAVMAILAASSHLAVAATDPDSDRTREILRYSCASSFGEHDLTLFANGTLRLWEGRDDRRAMHLAELDSEELAAFRARLSVQPFDSSQRSPSGSPSGEWVEQCKLTVTPDEEKTEYRFAPIAGMSLDLSHRVAIADELLAIARNRVRGTAFPPDYVPRRGDILIRADGTRFRVEHYTADRKGLEVAGIESPLLLYIAVDAVSGEFVGVEPQASDR